MGGATIFSASLLVLKLRFHIRGIRHANVACGVSFLLQICEGTLKFAVILLHSRLLSHRSVHGAIYLPHLHSCLHSHSHSQLDIWKHRSALHAFPFFVEFTFTFTHHIPVHGVFALDQAWWMNRYRAGISCVWKFKSWSENNDLQK